MSITFAGQALLVPPPKLLQHIEEYLPFDEASIFGCTPQSIASERMNVRGNRSVLRGIGRPNYPPPPKLRLNTLYWPTGASRWGRGLFLTDSDGRDAIVAKLEGLSGVGGESDLIIKDEEDAEKRTVTAKMRLLPPWPIAVGSLPESEEKTLWMLPLVDKRFFWQHRATENLTVNNSATWANLITAISSPLGVSDLQTDDVDSNYQQPDPEECERDQENAATLLDALLHSIGHRLIVLFDGTVKTENFTTAETTWSDNFNKSDHKPWKLVAGELRNQYERTAYPATVRVVFPKYIEEFRTLANGQIYSKDVTIADAGLSPAPDHTGVVDTVKLIYSTCMANYVYSSGTLGSTPDNQTNVDNLATQIAKDYYLSLSRQYSYCFASIKKWTPCAFDDAIEITAGWRGDQRMMQTRVWSAPVNFGAEEQLHQVDFTIDSPFPRAPAVLRVETDEALSQGSYATCSVIDADGNDPNGDAHTIEVFERILKSGTADIASGKKLLVFPLTTDSDDGIFTPGAGECP